MYDALEAVSRTQTIRLFFNPIIVASKRQWNQYM